MKDYSKRATCLYELNKKKSQFVWLDQHQYAFQSLIDNLINAPILVDANAHNLFILDTDASDTCVGAELIQVQNGVERVVCNGSFVMITEQRKYCTTRKELLAAIRFTRTYRHYLLGRSF